MGTPKKKNRAPKSPGLQPCPGLRHGIFTDCTGRAHDLSQQTPLPPKSITGTHGLPDSPRAVLRLIAAGQLYPVHRYNARVIRIYPAALGDYWARLTAPRLLRPSFLRAS